ncbi:MAG TPA: OPT family oligopeptide transporter [Kofleriaceae bacterium]
MSSEQPTAVVVPPGEDAEAIWLRDVYKPNEPNLTVRAVIVGALIGAVMCLSNIYVFFKTGWSIGVTLTACILGFSLFQALQSAGISKRPFGVLENNALTTVASGAGYMTGGGNMAAFGALLMVGVIATPSPYLMILWFIAIASLGVFAAIPIKRQLINQEALPFPTGTATAETIVSIHSATGGGASKAKALGWAALFAAGLTLLRGVFKVIPDAISAPLYLSGHSLLEWTIALKSEVVLLGGGALMSFRTGWSLLLGGLLTYIFLAPALLDAGLIAVSAKTGAIGYTAIVKWTFAPGAGLLVGAGVTSLLLDWRSLGRAFSGLTSFLRKKTNEEPGITAVESPSWWFPAGFLVLTPVVVTLMAIMFQIPIWAGLIAVPLAVLMGFIASRVTGETDVTPTKALGPVTQMLFGVLTPGNVQGNIMSANVTGGIGLHAADLLTTLKTGWLLGAKPRHQLYAQLFGVVAGALVVIPAFFLIIPVEDLGNDEWPAPSCVVWKGVSDAMTGGLGSMGSELKLAILLGLALGTLLTILEKVAPKRAKPFIPSPNGLGIAMIIPASNSIAMFIGATVAELLRRKRRQLSDNYVVPVASGLIAGESLMGVLVAILVSAGVIAK